MTNKPEKCSQLLSLGKLKDKIYALEIKINILNSGSFTKEAGDLVIKHKLESLKLHEILVGELTTLITRLHIALS